MDAAHEHFDEMPNQRLPFPSPRNDMERTENILWLIENEPQNWRHLVPFEEPDSEPSDDSDQIGISNLFGLIGSARANRALRGFRAELSPSELGRFDFFHHWNTRLMRAEANNPYLVTLTPPRYVPSPDNVKDMAREAGAAEARVYFGHPPRPPGVLGPLPPYRSGDTEFTILGRIGEREISDRLRARGYDIQVPLRRGAMRADAVRVNRRDVDLGEIKPDTPNAIRLGNQQMRPYSEELARFYQLPVNSQLHLYNREQLLRDIFGPSFGVVP